MTKENPFGMTDGNRRGMNHKTVVVVVVAVVLIALGGGYWLGNRHAANEGAISTKTQDGTKVADKQERKPLFYRNPMGLPDTSPVPKKDQMGMDYIPVFEGEEESVPGAEQQLRISTEKIQKLGVRTEAAAARELDRLVRAVGKVEVDERRTYTVAPKFEGWIERLMVNATGQQVAKGQALLEVYSPELVSAQREYAIAAEGMYTLKNASAEAQAGMQQLAQSSLARLRNWDISDEQLQHLLKSSEVRRTLTLRSPANGIVMEKKAVQGMRFMPGEALFQIADLSSVWIIADVFEQDLAQLKPGQRAKVRINAYPAQAFQATVAYVYPTLNPQTRTSSVRLELANPGGLLKPAMYAEVEFAINQAQGKTVTVPTSAVIHTGTRNLVLVQLAEGHFEPRVVKLGVQGDNYVEVLEGVGIGEQVVVTANFLIDAESNLKAAIAGFASPQPAAAEAKQAAPEPAATKGH